MRFERLKRRPLPRLLAAALLGLLLVALPPLGTLSYDLSQELKSPAVVTNLVLVCADEGTIRELGDGHGDVGRIHHAHLLERLTEQGARLVFYDFYFGETNTVPEADEALSGAMRKNGNVILVGEGVSSREAGAALQTVFPPAEIFRRSARCWGHAEIFGNVTRQIPRTLAGVACAAWVAAEAFRPKSLVSSTPDEIRWLNYYGYPDGETLTQYSFQEVLTNGLPAGALSNKVVFVGQRASAGKVASPSDTFETPYFWQDRVSGVCIHATAFLNLIHGDWLRQVSLPGQCLAAALWGVIITLSLHWLSRSSRLILILAGVGAAGALAIASLYVQWHFFWWWSWLGPAFGQTAFALGWAIVSPPADPYVAFISYRTQDDSAAALLIAEKLSKRGLKTFLDVKSLRIGVFDEQLLREIERSSYFILIISPNSLVRCVEPGDWMLRELRHAIQHNKTIIPVFKDNFRFEAEGETPDLPELKGLSRFHGLAFTTADLDGFVDKLAGQLTRRNRAG
jgi:CHASE2 domain-containing sensor protein